MPRLRNRPASAGTLLSMMRRLCRVAGWGRIAELEEGVIFGLRSEATADKYHAPAKTLEKMVRNIAPYQKTAADKGHSHWRIHKESAKR